MRGNCSKKSEAEWDLNGLDMWVEWERKKGIKGLSGEDGG